MPNPTYQLPRDSTMQGIVTQLQAIAENMSGSSGGSGGGSGTTVVANPSGTATGDLTSIQIGNDIYDIPVGSSSGGSSASGGSGYEATLIYDGSALSSLQSSIELDEEWDNYDAIVFTVNFGSNQSKTSGILYKDMLTANIGKIVGIAGFASVYTGATVNSDKKTFSNIYGGGDIQNIYGVYGLKFGAGGGSSSGGNSSSENTYTEEKSLTFLNTTTPFNVGPNFVSAEGTYANDDSYGITLSVNGNLVYASRTHNGTVDYTSTDCTYENGVFTFDSHFVEYYCGTSTVNFECVYSGGVVGSGYTETTLYTASSRSTTITLSDSIENYDAIEIEVSWTYNGTPYHISQVISPDVLGASQKQYTIGTSIYRYHTFTVATTTTTTFTLIDADSDTYISKVKGIKYGSGNSSSQEEYSTTEKVIGKWIDDKPVYQKTFVINLHTDGLAWVDTGCVIPNIEHIIDWSIVCEDTYVSGAPANIKTCSFRYNNNNIQIYGNTEWYLDLQAIIIKYTKTTD